MKKMRVTRRIEWQNVAKRAMKLSAYDARDAVDANGETQFVSNRMTDSDLPAVEEWTREAAHILESRMAPVLTCDGEYDEVGVTWSVIHDCKGNGFVKSAEEALAAWVLSQWFANRQTAMSERYAGVWANMSLAAVKLLKVRKRPVRPVEDAGEDDD